MPGYDRSRTASNISTSVSTTTTDAEPAPKLKKKEMEADRKTAVVTTDQRGKETATAATEATTETVGIQAIQTSNPAEDNNSDHGGGISPPDNLSTPKT